MTEIDPIVFVVDDDPSIPEALQSLVRSVGLRVDTFGSAQEFLTGQRSDAPGCLVLDVRLPGLSGLDLQRMADLYYRLNVFPISVIVALSALAVLLYSLVGGYL
jgi:FixJ family two-component response regulator